MFTLLIAIGGLRPQGIHIKLHLLTCFGFQPPPFIVFAILDGVNDDHVVSVGYQVTNGCGCLVMFYCNKKMKNITCSGF